MLSQLENNLHNKNQSSLQEVLLHKRRLVAKNRFYAVKINQKYTEDCENAEENSNKYY